jgi:hypothetical protein
MAKFYGPVGYVITEESDPINHPGVYNTTTEVRYVYGDYKQKRSNVKSSDQVNDDVEMLGEISFIGDEFALAHFAHIRFVKYLGVKWKVTSVSSRPPRLILSLGGVYNGE